jgi:PEP-CTERM motif
MVRMQPLRLFALCAGLLAGAAPAHALRIGTSAFSNFRIESFEHLTAGPTVGQQPGMQGVYLPGNGAPSYRFASGVTLVGPSADVFPGDPFVHDLRHAGAPPNDWGANGTITTPADVLMGSAYLAVFQAGSMDATIELTFDQPQAHVGAFVTGEAGSTITLEIYGEDGTLLESASLAAVPIDQWIDNFLGLGSEEGIFRVVFRGHDFGLDALLFDDSFPVAIPEPGTLALLAAGLLGLGALRRR